VFLTSAVALAAYVGLSQHLDPFWKTLLIVVSISLVSTLVEAISPHGWDNATLQVVPAFLGSLFL
jgi:hypothetical protein